MKSNTARILSVIFQLANAAAYFTGFLDAKTAALVAASLLVLKDTVIAIGDLADDGQKNGSFKP